VDEITRLNDPAKAIDYMRDEIGKAAYQFQMEVESGERIVVGVNKYVEDAEDLKLHQLDYSKLEVAQSSRLASLRDERNTSETRACLEAIRLAAQGSENLLPSMIDAVKSDVTLGEISDVLRDEWGEFDG
jgi:methylmalonyl-CoA mutase N-terminal domain/subunit